MTSIDSFKERERHLRESIKQIRSSQPEPERLSLYILKEELNDVRAHIRVLNHGHLKRVGSIFVPEAFPSLERQAYNDWVRANQAADRNTAQDQERRRETAVRLLSSLTPKQRQVLELHYSQSKSVSQIAEELGVTRSTVSRVLAEAKRKLQSTAGQMKKASFRTMEGNALNLSSPSAARTVLSTMSPTQAAYFFLYYAEGLSTIQIANMTRKKGSTISRVLKRAEANIGAMFPEETLTLENPAGLAALAYEAYLEIADQFDVLSKCKPASQDYCKVKRSAKVEVRGRPKAGVPGRLLTALLEREKTQNRPTVLRGLEVVFEAMQDRETARRTL